MFRSSIFLTELTLRPFLEKDIPFWQQWDVDEKIQLYMPEPLPDDFSYEEEKVFFEECNNDQEGFYWTIEKNDIPIGLVSLTEINLHHGIAELGIVIGDKNVWGKGVATMVIKAVLEYAVNEGIRRVVAETEEGNIGMENALLKSGFVLECLCRSARIKKGVEINTKRFVWLNK